MEEVRKARRKRKYPDRMSWTKEEDAALLKAVENKGSLDWDAVSSMMDQGAGRRIGKSGKQCRERYRSYLRPAHRKVEWTEAEKLLLLVLYFKYKSKWTRMGKFLGTRSDISIKNMFYQLLRDAIKRLKSPVVPLKFVDSPFKRFALHFFLHLFETTYLPLLSQTQERAEFKMKIILEMVRKRGITEELIEAKKRVLFTAYSQYFPNASFPFAVNLEKEELGMPLALLPEVEALAKIVNISPLGEIVRVRVKVGVERETGWEFPGAMPITALPDCVSLQPSPSFPQLLFNFLCPPPYAIHPFAVPLLPPPLCFPLSPLPQS